MNIATLRGGASTRALIVALSAPLAVAVPLSCAFAGGALPASGAYVSGSGTIAKSGKSGLTIDQSSATGIIDWNSFSIGRKNSVTFDNGSGATLNRVTGGNLSTIAGSLKATGSLYLINPQGMIVSGTGRVLTGGNFVGSSRDLSDDDFAHGKRRFTGTSKGAVVNQGTIRSSNGDVALIGSSASNSGILSASHGSASLDAGDNILLAPAGSNSHILVSGGTGDVTNSGTIAAAQAQLDAAGGNVYALSGNNGGIVRATGTSTIGGHVWLTSNTGKVSISGTVAATNANGSGGVVTARAGNIAISGNINTSATKAAMTGGTVSIVARNTTDVSGRIAAQGGDHGTGGFVETSGQHVHVEGGARITTLAKDGIAGDWLIDPNDFTIAASGGDITGTALSKDLKTGSVTIKSSHGATAGNGDIFVDANVSWSTTNALTLDAYRNIDINDAIKISGGGGLNLIYGDQAQTGTGNAADGDLSFGLTSEGFSGSVNYGPTKNGGTLKINGTTYSLLYSMSAVQAVDSSTKDLGGHYALATSLDGSGVSSWRPIGTDGQGTVLNNYHGFVGTFEGLGNTISNLTINMSAPSASYVGIFGFSDGVIRDFGVVGGSVYGTDFVGGLVGENGFTGTLVDVYTSVPVSSTGYIGGLTAYNGNMIQNAYATGSVLGSEAGGFVAENSGQIKNSYATGSVNGFNYLGTIEYMGGFAGVNSGTLTNVYATGSVTSANTGDTGGLVGYNYEGKLINTYATGAVANGTNVGGLVGWNSGTISSSYWDKSTSGSATGIGADFNGQSNHVIGKSTSQLQSALPSGFSSSVWGGGSGLYPYLEWQYDGTPEIVTGTIYSDSGSTVLAGSTVSLFADGQAWGTASSGTNGYYYFAVPASAIPSSNGQVLVYDSNADEGAFKDNANGPVSGLKIYAGYLSEFTTGTSYSTLAKDLRTALGSYSLTPPGLAIYASSSSAFDINTPIVSTGDVHLVASGALEETGTGVIDAASISGNAAGTVSLDGSNKISGLGTFSTGGNNAFSLTDALDLSTEGTVNVGTSNLTLTTTGSGHNLAIDSTISSAAQSVTLTSAGAITESNGGSVHAENLTGSSVGATTLAGANDIANLDAFTAGSSFSLTDKASLTVNGTVGTGAGALMLTTTGSSHNLAIDSTISSAAESVTLTSAGTITESNGGSIHAEDLTGSSAGATTLTASNDLANLDAFNTDGNAFALADDHDLTTIGAVDTGSAGLTLTLTGTSHALVIDSALGGGAVNLVSAAAISEGSGGTITGTSLAGTSSGAIALNGSNAVAELDGLDTGVSNPLSFADTQNLTVNGLVASHGGALTLKTTGTTLDVAGDLSGGTVTLDSGGTIAEGTTGSILASTLTGTSAGDVNLSRSGNSIKALGVFTTGSGDFSLATELALAITGPVQAAAVRLVSGGTISQNAAGTITATALNGSSKGNALFTAKNSISDLGVFATGGNHAFALTDDHDLTVNGAVNSGTASLALTTATGDELVLDAALTGGTLDLTADGAITEGSQGKLTASTLQASATSSIALTKGNQITSLEDFYSGSGSVSLTDDQSLNVLGSVSAKKGTVALTTNAGNLSVHGTLDGSSVTLVTAGEVTQSSTSAITAGTLNVTAQTGIDLPSTHNDIKKIGTRKTKSGPNVIKT